MLSIGKASATKVLRSTTRIHPIRFTAASVKRSVAAMAAPTTLIVKGDGPGKVLGACPFCQRAILTFERKKVPYTLEYIDFDNKPQWLLDVNGGKVPVIQEPGQPYMPDSDVIVAHLEEKYPTPSMKSSVPPEIGAKVFGAFRELILGVPADRPAKEAALVAELRKINDYLQQHGDKGPLFGGHELDATDAAVAPKLYQLEVALRHFLKWEVPADLAAVHKYLAAVKALPEWKPSDYGEAAIIKGWQRHLDGK